MPVETKNDPLPSPSTHLFHSKVVWEGGGGAAGILSHGPKPHQSQMLQGVVEGLW